VSEAAATPLPRRGRLRVVLILAVTALALSYAIVQISTREAGPQSVLVAGIGTAQSTFGGIPQEADRLGSDDAPVAIQLFTDLQCASCADDFLGPIPALVEERVRPGDVKLLMRHYSFARNPTEVGFYAAEAAAEQGYGWQYTYLFFANQEEAERFGIDEEFLESLAGAIGELKVDEWREYLEAESGSDGAITAILEGYEELGVDLGIRAEPAAIVTGPAGTRTLQDSPGLAQIEAAIEAVR
jgi:protein-disulfide isomerase